MNKQVMDRPRFRISVQETAPGTLTLSFVPHLAPSLGGNDVAPQPTAPFVVDVSEAAGQIKFDWHGHEPNADGTTQQEFEEEAQVRLAERKHWIRAITDLIAQVEQWARELGWSTRRIEKKLDDSRIGKHKVPALVMQNDAARTILEPVSRSVPGGRGLAELSLMPSYADIASFHLHDDGWYVHYAFSRTKTLVTASEPEARRLSAEVLGAVLAGMKTHAE